MYLYTDFKFVPRMFRCVKPTDLESAEIYSKNRRFKNTKIGKMMICIEMRVSQNPVFKKLAFLYHLIFEIGD